MKKPNIGNKFHPTDFQIANLPFPSLWGMYMQGLLSASVLYWTTSKVWKIMASVLILEIFILVNQNRVDDARINWQFILFKKLYPRICEWLEVLSATSTINNKLMRRKFHNIKRSNNGAYLDQILRNKQELIDCMRGRPGRKKGMENH